MTAKGKVLLHGVTGSAKSGGVLAIMGPSGAGKTTLLRMLTLTPTVVQQLRARNLKVGDSAAAPLETVEKCSFVFLNAQARWGAGACSEQRRSRGRRDAAVAD